jgi:putative transposase
MAQKRCINGEFRLRPDKEVVQNYKYTLACFANKYSILLHDFMGMSNHDHPLYTDPQGKSPLFIQQLHALVARSTNCLFGEWDSLWSGQRHSAVRLLETDDVFEKMVYVLLNPVAAGLVRYIWEWEGVTSWGMEYGVPEIVKKPDFFWSKKMPDEVELVIHRPEGLFPGMSDREARQEVRRQVKERQSTLVAEMRGRGVVFMGMQRVLRQLRHSTPRTYLERRGIRPHVATKNKWLRIEALGRQKKFWHEHEHARLEYKAGNRDIAFPYGTYRMKELFDVRVKPPP